MLYNAHCYALTKVYFISFLHVTALKFYILLQVIVFINDLLPVLVCK